MLFVQICQCFLGLALLGMGMLCSMVVVLGGMMMLVGVFVEVDGKMVVMVVVLVDIVVVGIVGLRWGVLLDYFVWVVLCYVVL